VEVKNKWAKEDIIKYSRKYLEISEIKMRKLMR
jgi:hypothetical protein